jgi:hypothetical protein
MSSYYIKSYCSIRKKGISLNNTTVFKSDASSFSAFIKSAYKSLDTKYPKFFKMDSLSKLAFLAADVLLKNENLDSGNNSDIAIILSNKASSLDTDRKHQDAIKDANNYYPSPSVFVYTLPNICIGEISIKYKLYSENSFFIFDSFNAEHLKTYSNSLLSTKKANEVLCGWVEFDGDAYEAFLYLVSEKGNIEHNIQNIQKLYNT